MPAGPPSCRPHRNQSRQSELFSGHREQRNSERIPGRLNWEIRVKRGLSYGAGSALTRGVGPGPLSFSATKNESGAEVAALALDEVKLATGDVAETELKPRKASLIGGFARGLETNNGVVGWSLRWRSMY